VIDNLFVRSLRFRHTQETPLPWPPRHPLFFCHSFQNLDLCISVVKDVQQAVFHQFLFDGSVFRKIAYYQIVQMQEAQLVNQILPKEISKYFWITRVKVGYDESLLCWIEMRPMYTCFTPLSRCGFRGLSSPIHPLLSRHRALQLICPGSIHATEQARGFEPPAISESHPISRLISHKHCDSIRVSLGKKQEPDGDTTCRRPRYHNFRVRVYSAVSRSGLGPSALICPTNSVTVSRNFGPSLAEIHSRRTLPPSPRCSIASTTCSIRSLVCTLLST